MKYVSIKKIIVVVVSIIVIAVPIRALHIYPFDIENRISIVQPGRFDLKDYIPSSSYVNITNQTFQFTFNVSDANIFKSGYMQIGYNNRKHAPFFIRPHLNSSAIIKNPIIFHEYIVSYNISIQSEDSNIKNLTIFNHTNNLVFSVKKSIRSIDVEMNSKDQKNLLRESNPQKWEIASTNENFKIIILLPSYRYLTVLVVTFEILLADCNVRKNINLRNK